MDLEGKNVLLLAPSFFGYEKSISTKLNALGANVEFAADEPSDFYSMLIEALRYNHLGYRKLITLFEASVYKKISGHIYDVVIVINGWTVTGRLVKTIKEKLLSENGRMILYYWDSLSVLKDDPERRKFFDKISTFDTEDYANNKDTMSFLPLFYCDEYYYLEQDLQCKTDLATVGSYKYNRYFEKIKKENPTIHMDVRMYASKTLYLHKLLRKKYKDIDLNTFIYKKFTHAQILEILKNSRAILDVPIKGQNGLTMRTFECLAMGKKLVTTNINVKKYDFYDPAYVYVLDMEDAKLPSQEWFRSNEKVPKEIIQKYSITAWLNNLLGE